MDLGLTNATAVVVGGGRGWGWRVNVVSPGVDRERSLRLIDPIAEHFGHPAHLPRAGLPHEMGSVVAFLAPRRDSYMTGANVNVDGRSDFT